MNDVSRKEKKYLISLQQYKQLSHYIGHLIDQDAHNGNDGYKVRSLYFDSLDDRDYQEKLAGIELRRKIRLRIYNPTDKTASLEIKQKQGENQRKRSLKISREDAECLCSGNYSVLMKYKEPFASECYGLMNMYCYRPKTIVEYKRKAYMAKENRIRITFDQEIRATESSFDLFSDTLPMNPVIDPYNVVLEVKYNGFLLSYIKDALELNTRSEMAVSKYVLARSITMPVNTRM